ncbi:MAG: hypothetical protein ACFFCQ_15165 [Promethearchaeota archaeon]
MQKIAIEGVPVKAREAKILLKWIAQEIKIKKLETEDGKVTKLELRKIKEIPAEIGE